MKNGMSPIKPIRFICICVLSFILIGYLPESFFAPFNQATAHMAWLCLAMFGEHPETSGALISLHGFQVQIITECTALSSIVLFGGFILSAASSLTSRLAGLLAGIPFLITVNTLRIALITMIGAKNPVLFESVHVYLAQVVMIILVVASAFAWLHWASGSANGIGMFLVRTFASASIIFPFWMMINRAYVKSLDLLVMEIFTLTNYRLNFTYEHFVYFQTCNVVLFTALLVADRRLDLRGKTAWLTAGMVLLAAGHLLFRIGNVLLTAFSWQPAFRLTALLTLVGEYLLPILFWLVASGRFGKPGDATGEE